MLKKAGSALGPELYSIKLGDLTGFGFTAGGNECGPCEFRFAALH
jgi:hypothetical protein